MDTQNNEINSLLRETIQRYFSPASQVLSIDSHRINMGLQAVDLSRHKVKFQEGSKESTVSLITKKSYANGTTCTVTITSSISQCTLHCCLRFGYGYSLACLHSRRRLYN